MRILMLAAMATAAMPAAAQTSVGNPPGNTLAPQTGAVAAPALPPAAPTGDLPSVKTPTQIAAEKYRTEVVCKTTVETGSLIARHKTCLTRKQWQYVNDENERTARKLVEDNMGRPTSN